MANLSIDGKLNKPAQVGNTRFSIGVSERLVIERAQREHEYQNTPEKEAERLQKIKDFQTALNQPDAMEQIRALTKSALTASDNSLRWYIEQIRAITQAGQESATPPSQEGHAAGPATEQN